MLSDIHCAISLSLVCTRPQIVPDLAPTIPSDASIIPPKPNWSADRAEMFSSSFELNSINDLCLEIDGMIESAGIREEDVNLAVEKTKQLLLISANVSGCMPKKYQVHRKGPKPRRRTQPHKPWFNELCEVKRKAYHRSKNILRRVRNAETTQNMRAAGKAYKREINKQYRLYQTSFTHKLRTLKSSNPKEYWSIINDKRQSNTFVSKLGLEAFLNHVKVKLT